MVTHSLLIRRFISLTHKAIQFDPLKMPLDTKKDLVVITSAGGQQAAHLVPTLYQHDCRLRLVVNSNTSQRRLQKQYPNAEVLIADLVEPSEASRVLAGAAVLYHVGPTFHTFETQIGYNLVTAALELRSAAEPFKHFVYSSVIHTQIRKLLNHDAKRLVEEFLIESGLSYTVVKPTHFMDMFPAAKLAKDANQQVEWPAWWDPEISSALIALCDLGEAASKIMLEREPHVFASYDLCGTEPMSHTLQCEIAGKSMGKAITPTLVDFRTAVNDFVSFKYGENVPSYSRDATERLFLYYNRYGLPGNPNLLRWILGREPTSFQAWVESEVKGSKSG